MSLLATIGLINEHEEGLVDAFVMTDEISLLLLQEGIDPSTVNRLHIPSGMSKVGTFTILCYLPAKWGIDDTEEIWARVGPIKWKLSRNYRIKRIFPNSIHENGTINTLCVVSFDDWRYELNLANSGTSQKTNTNVYEADWSTKAGTEENDITSVGTEKNGITPIELAQLEKNRFHLSINDSETEEPFIALENPKNAWEYRTKLSEAHLIDRVLQSSGLVAVPYPPFYFTAFDLHTLPAFETASTAEQYMICESIGRGWKGATESWNTYRPLYVNGQLQCAFGTPENSTQLYDAIDEMEHELDNLPEDSSEASGWLGHPKDATQEIPLGLDIQFPAKTPDGQIVLYVFESVNHGMPINEDRFTYANESVILTDHIKTKCSEDIPVEVLAESGITEIVIDPFEYEATPGISEERARELADRALHISRSYYARYYAGTGDWETMGFNLMRPFAGMLELEYFFRNGVPITRVSGDLQDARFGFGLTDMAKSTILSSGGIMLARPDGMTDISVQGGGSNDLLCRITSVTMDIGGCTAVDYGLERISDGQSFGGGEDLLIPTDRAIPNMCYEPIKVGDLVLFAFVPQGTDDDEPEVPSCDQDGCNYLFIAGEEVQTQECQ